MGSVLARQLQLEGLGASGQSSKIVDITNEIRRSLLAESDVAVVEQLREANIEDVKEAITIYEDLGYSVHMSRAEFVEVFGIVFSDPDEAFDLFQVEAMASMYEVSAACLLLCAHDESLPPEFDWKLRHIFDMFDLDGSQDMSRDELSILLRSAADGLASTCGRPRPHGLDLDNLADEAFATLGISRDDSFDFESLMSWVLGCDSVAHYVDVYTSGQLRVPGATARLHDSAVHDIITRFNEARGTAQLLPVSKARELVEAALAQSPVDQERAKGMASDLADHLQSIELKANYGLVSKDLFEVCVAPAVAFVVAAPTSATQWTETDVKVLLWIISKREPMRKAVSNVIAALGGDFSRRHWLRTHTTRSVGIKSIILSHARRVFDAVDANQDGYIQREEMRQAMWALLGKDRSVVNERLARAVCLDFADELYAAMDKEGDEKVDWETFVGHSELLQKRFMETRNVLVAQSVMKVHANHRGGMLLFDDPAARAILGMVVDHSEAEAEPQSTEPTILSARADEAASEAVGGGTAATPEAHTATAELTEDGAPAPSPSPPADCTSQASPVTARSTGAADSGKAGSTADGSATGAGAGAGMGAGAGDGASKPEPKKANPATKAATKKPTTAPAKKK